MHFVAANRTATADQQTAALSRFPASHARAEEAVIL